MASEGAGVQYPRRGRQARRHPRQQHLDAGREQIAAVTKRPQDVIGMHFFSPANVMKLLEVVRGAATARRAGHRLQIAKKIKKVGVVSGVCDGFIGNRMIEHYGRVAGFLRRGRRHALAGGRRPWRNSAWRWAPSAWATSPATTSAGPSASAATSRSPTFKYAKIADKLCELGRFGQKTGMGWYRYEAGERKPSPDPVVDAMIEDYRKEQGIARARSATRRSSSAASTRWSTRARACSRRASPQRASDIDMVYLTGYGFPLHRGGPMLYADTGRPLQRRATSRAGFAAEPGDPQFWQPAPLLAKLAAEGKTL
jgi:3-hydroxyacyl-CoA dehydrogenase